MDMVNPPPTWRVALLVVAIILFVLTAFWALNMITWTHGQALGWFGLACVALAFI